MPALSCARHWRRDPAGTAHVCEALFPRVPGRSVRTPFLTHHVVLNLGFTLTILHFVLNLILFHVVLGYFHCTPCAVSLSLHATCGPWCFLSRTLVQQRLSRAARCLVVSSSTPLLPSACCKCGAFSPELGCTGCRLAKRLHVSLFLKAAAFLFLFAHVLSPALLRGDQSRMHLCQIWSSSEGFEASLPLLPGSSRAPRTSEPSRSGSCAVVWNTCTRRFCCSVTLFCFSVLVLTALSTSSAASSRCS